MDEVNRQNITINGSGTVGGGHYGDIRINGSGVINDEVDCRSLTINGMGSVNGMLTADVVTINGSGTLGRLQHVDKLQINGEGTVQGDAVVKELAVHGSASFHGSVTAEGIAIHGAITVQDDCNAERFAARGGFTIGGLLNADTIEILLHGDCRVREIGGSAISVTQAKGPFSNLNKLFQAFINHPHGLTADTIEGDDLHLEYTTAKVVRGKRITLGPGCEIELVEYTESLEVANDAKVKEQAKVVSAQE